MDERVKIKIKERKGSTIIGVAEIYNVIISSSESSQGEVVELKKKFFKADTINNTYEVEEGVSMADAYQIGILLNEKEGNKYSLLLNKRN